MTRSTKGPWASNTIGQRTFVTVGGKNLAEMNLRDTWQETEANARLMAAAPELLEACREVMGMLDRGDLVRPTESDGDPDWVFRMMEFVPRLKKIADAIEKAKG